MSTKLIKDVPYFVRPGPSIIRTIVASYPSSICNLKCDYCIAIEQKKYKIRSSIPDLLKYMDVLNCSSIQTGSLNEPFCEPHLLENTIKFLKKPKVYVSTNGYNKQLQLNFLDKYPNLYLNRSVGLDNRPFCHHDKDLINHERVKNFILITPDSPVEKCKNIPNGIIKFLYKEGIKDWYKGSYIQKYYKKHPEEFDCKYLHFGFENSSISGSYFNIINKFGLAPSIIYFLKKHNNNLVYALGENIDSYYYNAYNNNGRILSNKVLDYNICNEDSDLQYLILKDHPEYNKVKESHNYYLNLFNEILNEEYNETKESLEVICDITPYNLDDELCDMYARLYYSDKLKINILKLNNLTKDNELKNNELCIIEMPYLNLLKDMNVRLIGKYGDIIKLLSEPFNFNLNSIRSTISFKWFIKKIIG